MEKRIQLVKEMRAAGLSLVSSKEYDVTGGQWHVYSDKHKKIKHRLSFQFLVLALFSKDNLI